MLGQLEMVKDNVNIFWTDYKLIWQPFKDFLISLSSVLSPPLLVVLSLYFAF